MRSSSGAINIAAITPKIEVDNRFSLNYYYRVADKILQQADIYREEKNVIDLYIMLLRYSSLVMETIPSHRDYPKFLPKYIKGKLLNVLKESETLKPEVQLLVEELNRKYINKVNSWEPTHKNAVINNSWEWPPVSRQTPSYDMKMAHRSTGTNGFSRGPIQQDNLLHSLSSEERFRKLSLNIPRPKEETLSRHSILGPNGLYGQWHPPAVDRGVKYPSNLDLTAIEFPSLTPLQEENVVVKQSDTIEQEKSAFEEVLSLHDDSSSIDAKDPPMITLDALEEPVKIDIIRQPSPPPVLASVQDLVTVPPSQTANFMSGQAKSVLDEIVHSESPLEVHISTKMMDSFMRMAKSNTLKNLETCGVLAGSLKNRKFSITALIIPKQESTSDTCQTTNEEEIFDYQDKNSLFPLGWIHTHPTQSCFMSSVDLHTHYSYQVMLPEAIAIVMAPRDTSKTHGIFRLTSPGGMSVIRHCQQRGFHAHREPPDGGRIYDHCSDVYMNPSLKFDVVDLR
ncbi:AMSH-like ubiquitin thioesterase 1 [Acorus gramineus]|uniref:AMSH-like ubiquitin thioesterase 1 n=1 Tax=Acorus gramineus TaxID=55184 RepID=A0AAV9BXS9_ACOGR|nr:AMSH-like ubiquitin thioesterase 1 [Acorus gramineus]